MGIIEDLKKFIKIQGYSFHYNSFHSPRGVGLLISDKLKITIVGREEDELGNFLLIKAMVKNSAFVFGSIYGPNTNENMEVYNNLSASIGNLNCNKIILGGDWNCTWDFSPVNENIDVLNMQNIPSRPRSIRLHEICEQFNLTDPFRIFHPNKREYTYIPSGVDRNNKSRLDFFVISRELLPQLFEVNIANTCITHLFDHKQIFLNFRRNTQIGNRSVLPKSLEKWDITLAVKTAGVECYIQHARIEGNFTLLEKERLLGIIGQIMVCLNGYNETRLRGEAVGDLFMTNCQEFFAELPDIELLNNLEMECNPEFFFEALCNQMRNAALKQQSQNFKFETHVEQSLNREINTLKQEPVPDIQRISELEDSLSTHIQNKLVDLVKLHKRYEIIHSERITPIFMQLVNCTKNDESLNIITTDNGEEFANPTDRENFIRNSYREIFEIPEDIRANETDISVFLGPNILNNPTVVNSKLSEEEKLGLEGPLTIGELDKSVRKSKPKSAPGADGISNSFIKKFWDFFRVPLFKVANLSFERNRLPDSFRSANIKLIPKKGNNKFLKNWRPISLLNCFYKIISRAMGNRLKTVMDKLTPIGQKGHSKTRRCQEVLLNLIEAIDECKSKKIKGCILSLDIRKAFDCVSHDFIKKTLKFFNFGENMIKYLLLLSTNRRACILLDGKRTTEFFPLNRGNAQGDIISPFIFNLCYQILLFKIQYDESIVPAIESTQIPIPGGANQVREISIKVLAMADDANCVLRLDYGSLANVKVILECYRLMSGFECNIEKTLLIPIGKVDDISDEILGLGFDIKNSGKIVGMEISNNLGNYDQEVDKIIQKMDGVVRDFSRFSLSLPGRINVAKTFLYSQLNYLGSFIPFNAEQIKRFNKKIETFVKGNLNISSKRVFAQKTEGGLGLFEVGNFLNSQKCTWFRYLAENNDYWKSKILENANQNEWWYITTNNVRGGEIVKGIVGAVEKMVNCCIKDKKLFWESKLAYNNLIPTRGLRSRIIDNEFFGPEAVENPRMIIKLKTGNLYINGTLHSWENFVFMTGVNISRENHTILTRAVEMIRTSLFGDERVQPEQRLLKKLFRIEAS